jgi:predicted DNA-binding transcriptional regulator AlpA
VIAGCPATGTVAEVPTNTSTPTASPYRSASELADHFGVSVQTIGRAAKTAGFPAGVRLGKRCKRWRLDDVEAWAAAGGFDVDDTTADDFFDGARRRGPQRTAA